MKDLSGLEVGGFVRLHEEAGNHFIKVLRLKEQHPIELFDGNGLSVHGILQEASSPKHVFASITSITFVYLFLLEMEVIGLICLDFFFFNFFFRHYPPSLPPLLIAQGWIKSSKAEEVVQRSTELGSSQILFWKSIRTSCKSSPRFDRLQGISNDASRQSGRVYTPTITPTFFSNIESIVKYV